jgi:serine/threonine-protein kinase
LPRDCADGIIPLARFPLARNEATPVSNQLPSPNPIAPGTVLAGKYRVERILGQGGMGVVVEARHIALEERVALKFLLPEYATHPEASARFLREARAAVKIKSEHVARVSDVGTLDTGAPYMVMEYLDGHDLRSELEKTGVLQLEDAVDYVIQGCDAIAEAHSYGIVHRDLKPANLFLTKRANGTPLVKVLDFGISKMTGGGIDNLTKTTAAMGSALYMSPEQMQASRGVDHRTDIYALGISLYELLAGRQPFYADTLPQLCAEVFTGTPSPIRQLRPDLPEAFAVALEKAYARDRAQRYQTIAEFVLALAPFAPARSRTAVESVAKLAGMDVPAAGVFPQPALAANGTQLIAPMGQTPPGGQYPPAPPPAYGSQSSPQVMGTPSSPQIGSQSSPQALGSQSTPNMVSAVAPPTGGSSKGALVAVGVLGVLGIAATAAFFMMRSAPAVKAAPASPVATETTAPSAVATTPPAPSSATPAPTAPDTAAAAPPTASAIASAAPAAPPTVAAGGKHLPGGKLPGKAPSATPATPPPAKPPPTKDVAGF